jgi:Cu-Zn family superoxide dismutase
MFFKKKINAKAKIAGGTIYPNIKGLVYFQEVDDGTEVSVSIIGLPEFSREDGKFIAPFAFHIHNGNSCYSGDNENPFPDAGTHYNPDNDPHGNHAGDFPVLFSHDGLCVMSFYTNRFKPIDVVGMTVIIHESPDDFRTNPAGNSGRKIACGVIEEYPW